MENDIIKEMKLIEDTIPINIEVIEDKTGFTTIIKEHNLINGCIAHGKTLEESKQKLIKLFRLMLDHYKYESKQYYKKVIFIGNRTKQQLWFTIIGIGIIFYIRPKDFTKKFPNARRRANYQFHIGRLYWSFINRWKNIK